MIKLYSPNIAIYILICMFAVFACNTKKKQADNGKSQLYNCEKCDLEEIDGKITQIDSIYTERTESLINGELNAEANVKINNYLNISLEGSLKPTEKQTVINWIEEETKDEFPAVKDYARWRRGIACSLIKFTCKNSTFTQVEKDSIYLAITNEYYEEVNKLFPLNKEIKMGKSEEANQSTTSGTGNKSFPANTCNVIGLVKDLETNTVVKMASVILTCDSIYQTTTNENGHFSFKLPISLEGERCLIRAGKSGKSKELFIPICDPNIVDIRID